MRGHGQRRGRKVSPGALICALLLFGITSGAHAQTYDGSAATVPLDEFNVPNDYWLTTGAAPGYAYRTGWGFLQAEGGAGRHAVYGCLSGSDHFLSTDSSCEGATVLRIEGWAWDAGRESGRLPLTRCRFTAYTDRWAYWGEPGVCGTEAVFEASLGYVDGAQTALVRYFASTPDQHGATGQSVTTSNSRGGQFSAALGFVVGEWGPGMAHTRAISSCMRGTDEFLAADGCPSDSTAIGDGANIYIDSPGPASAPLYACQAGADGFASRDAGCEGSTKLGMLGWILTDEYDQDGDGVRPPQDCVPTDPTAHPGGAEVPDNGVDEDCSGGDAIYDADHDGHPAANDCNDRTAAVHPGATDIPGNGIDEDCNGTDASTSAATATAIATPAPTTEATPASRRALLVAVDRRVGVPHGVPAQAACRGRMEGTVLVGRRRIAKVRLKLGLTRVRLSVRGGETIKTTARRRECRYQGIATVARSRVGKAISVSLAVKFYGNAHVRSSRTRWSVSVVRVLRDNS